MQNIGLEKYGQMTKMQDNLHEIWIRRLNLERPNFERPNLVQLNLLRTTHLRNGPNLE